MLVTPRLAGAVLVLALLTVRAGPDARQVFRCPDDDGQGVDLFGAHLRAATNPDDLTVDHDRAALVGGHLRGIPRSSARNTPESSLWHEQSQSDGHPSTLA